MRLNALICVAFSLVVADLLAAGEVDVPDLKAMTPRITIGSPLVDSFTVHGQRPVGHLAFDVMYAKPEHLAVRFTDTSDGTPFFIACGRDVLVYDSPQGRIFVGSSKAITFVFRADFETQRLLLGAFIDEDGIDTVDVNFRSLFGLLKPPALSKRDATNYDLDATSTSGNPFHASYRIDAPLPLNNLTLSVGEVTQLQFDNITINQPIPEGTWQFPAKEKIAEIKTDAIEPWLRASKQAGNSNPVGTLATVDFRWAIKHADARTAWEKEHGPVDWKLSEQKDTDISRQLRELFKPAK